MMTMQGGGRSAAVRAWATSRRGVCLIVSAAVVCFGLAAAGSGSRAYAALPPPIPTCAASAANCTPPGLLNDTELTTPFEVNPSNFYAATGPQQASLHALEQQAIANTLADHGLPASDSAAVKSWGRAVALAELWGLVVQAIQAANPTSDQQNVVAWLTTVMHRRAQAEADSAAWEFLKWAGLLPGNQPIPAQSTLLDLLNRVSNGALVPIQYDTGSNQNATSGFCQWQPPSPFQGEYTGDFFTPAAQSTADSWCFPPYHCSNVFGCNNNEPTYDQFVKYGDADVENARADNIDSSVLTNQVANALAAGGVTVGGVGIGLALGSTLGPVLTGSPLLTAIFPFSEQPFFDVVTSQLFPAVPGEVFASAVGSAVGIIIAAVAIAVTQGIQVAANASLPGKLSSLIANAASGTPDLQAMLGNSQQLAGLFGVFLGASLPNPLLQACDNSALTVQGAGITPAPCLNAPPIPAPTASDPQFLITPKDSTQASLSDSISWTDINGGSSDPNPISHLTAPYVTTQDTARLTGGWFVTHITDANSANGNPAPAVTTTPESQSLSIHYVDWQDLEQTAWLVRQPDGSYKFMTVLGGVQVSPLVGQVHVNPTTCLADKTCAYSDSIHYIRADSLTGTPDVSFYSATVTAAVQPAITVIQPETLTEGSAATFTASVSGGAGPLTDQWFFQTPASLPLQTCGPPSACGWAGPFSGSQVSYTPQAPGPLQGVLLVTDSGGRVYERDFTFNVAGVAPKLTLGPADVHRVDLGGQTTLTGVVHHAGGDDTETVSIDWGDGSTVSNTVSGRFVTLVPGLTFTFPSGTEIDFTGTHVYDRPGTYPVTVTVADGGGGTATQTTSETVRSTTQTNLSSNANPAVHGQPVTFTATVSSSGPGTPTGTVTFYDGSTNLGTGTVSTTGGVTSAMLTTAGLAVSNSHSITAAYGGDDTSEPSTSTVLGQTVNKAATSTSLSSIPDPSVWGQLVTFTAQVSVDSPGAGGPSGTVEFKDGPSDISGCASQPVDTISEKATCTTSALSVAGHSVTAFYNGDGNFTGSSTASPRMQTVNKATTSVALSSSNSVVMAGQSVKFTATVAAVAPGAGTPTGTVTFRDGTTTLGTGALNGNGVATIQRTTLRIGAHSVTASYGGDAHFKAATSAAANQYIDTNLSQFPKSPNGAYDLSDANLKGAYLAGLSLAGASLSNSNLIGAVFLQADLTGADLSNSNLRAANLSGADLTGAAIVGSNLRGAKFTNAILAGADLASTILRGVVWDNTICPDGTVSTQDGGSCAGHL